MLLHLSMLPIDPTSVYIYTLHACSSWWLQNMVTALHCLPCGTTCVCVGGGDEGGHPLPGLRRQSQEAHLQNGRYVRSSSYVCMFSWHIYIYCTYVYISDNKLLVRVFIAPRPGCICMHA